MQLKALASLRAHAVDLHLQQEVKAEALGMLLLGFPRPQQEPLRWQVAGLQHPFFPAAFLHLCQHVHSARVQPQCRSSVRDDRGCRCILLYSNEEKNKQKTTISTVDISLWLCGGLFGGPEAVHDWTHLRLQQVVDCAANRG